MPDLVFLFESGSAPYYGANPTRQINVKNKIEITIGNHAINIKNKLRIFGIIIFLLVQ